MTCSARAALRGLLLLLLLSFPYAAHGQGASESLERDARAAFKSGRFKEAAIKFQDAAAAAVDAPRRAKMEIQAAHSWFNDKNPKSAREAAHRAAVADPEFEFVPEFYAPEFVRLVEEERRAAKPLPKPAVVDLDEARRIAAEKLKDGRADEVVYDLSSIPRERMTPELVELLARAYEALGRPEQAAAVRRGTASPAAPGAPPSPAPSPALPAVPTPGLPARGSVADFLATGRSALERGDAFTAQAAANRALELQPNSSEAYRLLGESFLARGEKELGEANLKQALRWDEKNEPALLSLADAAIARKDWDAAIDALKRASALNPVHAARLVALGRRLRSEGDLPHAGQIYAAAVAAIPTDAQTLSEYGSLLLQAGDLEAALEPLGKATLAAPSSPVAHANLAAVERKKGSTADAEREYREALGADPDYTPALLGLGSLLSAAGKHAEAADLFRRAVAKEPQRPEAVVGLSRELRASGKLDEAAAALEAAKDVPDPAVIDEAGVVACERGRWAEGEALFEKALARQPESPVIRANRDKAKAAAAFLKALASAAPPAPAPPAAR